MATTTRNLTTYGVLLLAGLAMAPCVDAASSCAADCGRRMAECRTASCGDLDQKACRDRCRAITGCRAGGARIRTFASIVSRCRVAGGMVTAEQRLDVRRGDCPPQTIVRFAAPGAAPDAGLCRPFGEFRNGSLGSWTCDPFGASPIGHQLFAIRADGSGLRQVTNYDGLRERSDGSFSVELPLLVYSARGRSAGHRGAGDR